jgi:anti-sigma regulatory factor (Ser/Thr protein kinase)
VSRRLERTLPREPSCGAVARRWIEQNLGDQLSPQPLRDLKLIVSELVTNAYLHGKGQIRLILEAAQSSVRVEVVDQGEGVAIAIRREGLGEGGQGLQLVDAISTRWGAFEGTTHVWAEMSLDE